MKKSITSTFACLTCRKSFKKDRFLTRSNGTWEKIDYEVVCPQCRGKVYDAGSAFKAPKMKDKKEWDKLKSLFESGYRFNPDFGSPFIEKEPKKETRKTIPKSEFRKPARKRNT